MRRMPPFLLALVLLALSVPISVASQEASQINKTWVAFGYGGGSFGAWSGGSTVAEVAHQRGANVFALHVAGRAHAVYEWINGGGFLYRRVVAGRATQWSVGAGVSYVDFHICDDTPEEDGGPCPHRATVGLPLVVDVSRQLAGVLGGGVQAFANLNSEQSFIGLAVVLKLGDLR